LNAKGFWLKGSFFCLDWEFIGSEA